MLSNHLTFIYHQDATFLCKNHHLNDEIISELLTFFYYFKKTLNVINSNDEVLKIIDF
jgi:hypothetical protein